MFAVMYIKYIQIFRRIEECYDQVNLYYFSYLLNEISAENGKRLSSSFY